MIKDFWMQPLNIVIFFLQEHNGKLALKQDHAYIFQIQMQMKFVVLCMGILSYGEKRNYLSRD